MTATTPSEAGLLEGYDRSRGRGEEQIGSGILPSMLEVPDTRYELNRVGYGYELFGTLMRPNS